MSQINLGNDGRNMSAAKKAKKDEFYTQYTDITREMEAYLDYDVDAFRGKTVLLPCDDPEWSNFTRYFAENFERIGLKKLISTSYAFDAKKIEASYLPGFESLTAEAIRASPKFDRKKERKRGKIFVLDEDTNRSGRIDIADLKWDYLNGDGDFRSDEVKSLRDEADIIVTNPPFSLFREFLAWILAAKPGGRGLEAFAHSAFFAANDKEGMKSLCWAKATAIKRN